MFRGMKTFVCDDCGHRFKGMDIEWRTIAFSNHLDVLNRSYVVNLKLITGYVNDDKAVIPLS